MFNSIGYSIHSSQSVFGRTTSEGQGTVKDSQWAAYPLIIIAFIECVKLIVFSSTLRDMRPFCVSLSAVVITGYITVSPQHRHLNWHKPTHLDHCPTISNIRSGISRAGRNESRTINRAGLCMAFPANRWGDARCLLNCRSQRLNGCREKRYNSATSRYMSTKPREKRVHNPVYTSTSSWSRISSANVE